MRIMGVDPGTLRTGVGVIDAEGERYQLVHTEVISPKSAWVLSERLYHIYQGLIRSVQKFKPAVIALENVFLAATSRPWSKSERPGRVRCWPRLRIKFRSKNMPRPV